MSLFRPAIEEALGHEGAFTDDPRDPGNWTGGKVGVGQLKGTKFGVSAMTYPDIDIKSLQREEAIDIYERDWWNPGGFSGIEPQKLCNKVFGFAINGSRQEAIELLQIAVSACGYRTDVDGKLGPQTLNAVALCVDKDMLLACYKAGMAARYDTITDLNRGMRWARGGWLNRAFA